MHIIFFAVDQQGRPRFCRYSAPDFVQLLDLVTEQMRQGWQLKRVKLVSGAQSIIDLPVEAFNEAAFGPAFAALEQQWKEALTD